MNSLTSVYKDSIPVSSETFFETKSIKWKGFKPTFFAQKESTAEVKPVDNIFINKTTRCLVDENNYPILRAPINNDPTEQSALSIQRFNYLTTEINFEQSLPFTKEELPATGHTPLSQLFTDGVNFGQLSNTLINKQADRNIYASGYYQNFLYISSDSIQVINKTNSILLLKVDSIKNLNKAFRPGDQIRIMDKTYFYYRVVDAEIVSSVDSKITVKKIPNYIKESQALSLTNLTHTSSFIGSSGQGFFNDVPNSAIGIVDRNKNLLAMFYYNVEEESTYHHAIAFDTNDNRYTIASGTFHNPQKLFEYIKKMVYDTELTYYKNSSISQLEIDHLSRMIFKGQGLIGEFRVLVNQDNSFMRNYFKNFLYRGDNEHTQAIPNLNGKIPLPKNTPLDPRAGDETLYWFQANSSEKFLAQKTITRSPFGETAALPYYGGKEFGYLGRIEIKLINALGKPRTFYIYCVRPDKRKIKKKEASNLYQLAERFTYVLRLEKFSSYFNSHETLVSDPTALCELTKDGRFKFTTELGIYHKLQIRSSEDGFNRMLGSLYYGATGKCLYTNRLIQADITYRVSIYNKFNSIQYSLAVHMLYDRPFNLCYLDKRIKVYIQLAPIAIILTGNSMTTTCNKLCNYLHSSQPYLGSLKFDLSGNFRGITHIENSPNKGSILQLELTNQYEPFPKIELNFSNLSLRNQEKLSELVIQQRGNPPRGELTELFIRDGNHLFAQYTNQLDPIFIGTLATDKDIKNF